MLKNGTQITHRLFGQIFNRHRICPVGRALLHHLHAQADFTTATYSPTNAWRLAEEIGLSRTEKNQKIILRKMRKLKSAGLLVYPENVNNGTYPVFLPLYILGIDKGKLAITRPWGEVENISRRAGLLKPDESSEKILDILSDEYNNGLWPYNERLYSLMVKNVAPNRLQEAIGVDHSAIKSISKILEPKPAETTPEQQTNEISEEQHQNNLKHLERINSMFTGGTGAPVHQMSTTVQ